MTYEKQTWEDYPSLATPTTASRLNHMEDGIYRGGRTREIMRVLMHESTGNTSGTTLADLPGLAVSGVTEGGAVELTLSGMAQISLAGAAANTIINFQTYFYHVESTTSYWVSALQSPIATTAMIVPSTTSLTIANLAPGRQTFKVQAKMSSASGAGTYFGGSFSGAPTFQTTFTMREIW